jgi:hypothetical protein
MEDLNVVIDFTMVTYQEVESCSECNGTGIYITEKMTCYHNNDWESIHVQCNKCDGTGRYIIEKTEKKTKIRFNDNYSGTSEKIIQITNDTDLMNLKFERETFTRSFK